MGGRYIDERRKRGGTWRVLRIAALAALSVTMVILAYMVGTREGQVALDDAQRQIELLDQGLAAERRTRQDLEATLSARERDIAGLAARLEAEVPGAAMRAFTAQIERRIAEGVAPDRVAMMIDRAQNPRGCEPAGGRRLVVRVPPVGQPTPMTWIGDQLQVGVDGTVALGNDGAFDPGHPVLLRVATQSGRQVERKGKLPLTLPVFLPSAEWRVALQSAPGRGQVSVTLERCLAP
jgi:hypothetical protein